MEVIRQTLNTHGIDISAVEDLVKIYTMLGNQQESKKIYAVLNNYLKDIDSGFSIWENNNSKKLEMVWYKDDKSKRKEFEKKDTLINTYRKTKNPIFEQEKSGIYAIIPVVSREVVQGYFCIHDEVEIDERWKRIYVVVTMLAFIFKYYEMIKESNELSVSDLMTGLYNYRHFALQLQLEVDKAKRFKRPLSLVTVRIKDFDMINHKLGFEGGEIALNEFAKIFERTSRKTDMPSRLNDEVFAVLLYETNKKGADVFILRLIELMKNIPIDVNGNKFHLELEYNVSEYDGEATPEEFLSNSRKF